MNSFSNVLLFLLLLIFQENIALAQLDCSFIDHLSKNKLQQEHYTYLSSFDEVENTDSLHYLKAKYYLQYFNDSLFLNSYDKCNNLFTNDTSAFNLASLYFLNSNSEKRSVWFETSPNQTVSAISRQVYTIYLASIDPLNVNVRSLPQEIQDSFCDYQKYHSRKPLAAAGLSLLVPGLGKAYAGRPRSFFMTLFSHAIYGAQTYEAINKLGIHHPFSIFSLSFFSIFYAANIYGSFNNLKEARKHSRNEMLHNAINLYHIHSSPDLLYK